MAQVRLAAFVCGGLFDEDTVPVAVLVAGAPGARWLVSVLECRLAGETIHWKDLLVAAGQSTMETLILYGEPEGPSAVAARGAGWGFVGLRGGGHVGFDVVDPAGTSRAFVNARSAVGELGTRSVKRVRELRPHWMPRYAPRRGLFCWPPERSVDLAKGG